MTIPQRGAALPVGSARARPTQLLGAAAVDVVALVIAATPLALAVLARDGDLVILGLLVLVGALVGCAVAWARTGRTLGTWMTGVRQVATRDAAPPGLELALSPSWFADVRSARDPVDPRLPELTRTPAAAAVPAPAERSPRSTSRTLVVIDGRVEGAIGDGVVLGRAPTATAPDRAVPITDIGRELSKVHVALRVDARGTVWADDRNSTNGTVVTRVDGSRERLVPGQPSPVRVGDRLELGGHTVTVQHVTEVTVGAS